VVHFPFTTVLHNKLPSFCNTFPATAAVTYITFRYSYHTFPRTYNSVGQQVTELLTNTSLSKCIVLCITQLLLYLSPYSSTV
jgi:TRAP-type C4-dicarboxylate transport system permease large subunit